jgi:hypothetical protein
VCDIELAFYVTELASIAVRKSIAEISRDFSNTAFSIERALLSLLQPIKRINSLCLDGN